MINPTPKSSGARPVVFCAVGSAVATIRTRFPGIDVIDISEGVPGHALGEVLFTGAGEPSLEAISHGVRWVHWVGTGIDGVPLALRDVEQFSVSRGASALPISEYVMATMSAFARDFPDNWIHEPPLQWHYQPAVTLAGATVALFGFGGIGQRVAHLAQSYGMSIVALRRRAQQSPVPGVRMVRSFADLVTDADHVVLAAPATPETHHIVNADSLDRMKQGVHLVNVARGSLVDQEALRPALDAGKVGRASLDVTDPEPLPANHWLYSHPRAYVTPHSSWVGPPMFSAAVDSFCENLSRYLAAEPLLNLVNGDY